MLILIPKNAIIVFSTKRVESVKISPRLSHKGLVTNYREGGLQKGRGGGACEVLPLRKGGRADKALAMLNGGHKSFGVVFKR